MSTRAWRHRIALAIWAIACTAAIVILIIPAVGTALQHVAAGALLVIFGLGLLYVLIHLLMAMNSENQPTTSSILENLRLLKRCAHCGYDIAQTKPDSDGCSVCPECGSAWRLLNVDDPAVAKHEATNGSDPWFPPPMGC